MSDKNLFRCPSCLAILSTIYRGKGENCQECDWGSEADEEVSTQPTPEDAAWKMREQGNSLQAISDHLKVPVRTIRRWTHDIAVRKKSEMSPRTETLFKE